MLQVKSYKILIIICKISKAIACYFVRLELFCPGYINYSQVFLVSISYFDYLNPKTRIVSEAYFTRLLKITNANMCLFILHLYEAAC